MKRLIGLLISVALAFSLCACSSKSEPFSPEEKQIKSICELATLKCYYHNVATIDKEAGNGLSHLLEKDRSLWIEYTGYAKLGIDMSKVSMTVEGNEVTITIPEAKVLYVDVEEDSMVFYKSKGGIINRNKITPDEQTQAVEVAQNEMQENAQNNSLLIMNAQEQAKEMIENYIKQIAETAGVEYHTTWLAAENTQPKE